MASLPELIERTPAITGVDRAAHFASLCRALVGIDRAQCLDAVDRIGAATSGWPAIDRRAPPLFIHALVRDAVPYEVLRILGALRLFDLVLDEASLEPPHTGSLGDRFAALRRWAEDMPSDPRHGVRHLDWSRTAWEAAHVPQRAPRGRGAAERIDYRELTTQTVLTVLRSPMCAALEVLDLSRGPWTAESLTNHDHHDDAESVCDGFLAGVRWSDLRALPCAATLTHLALHGTDLRLGELDFDEDDFDGAYAEGAAPFPRLRWLDAGGGLGLQTNAVLAEVVRRGAAPRLEALAIRDDLSPRMARARAESDEADLVWLHHDYVFRPIDPFMLRLAVAGAPALRRIVVGDGLGPLQVALAKRGRPLPPRIDLVADDPSPPAVAVPW